MDSSSKPKMLTLICPGLLGPVPVTAESLPRVRTLDRLLARADRIQTDARDASTRLLDEFGIGTDPESDAPTAPLALMGELSDVRPEGYWLHADPVHLRADRERLLLFAGAGVAPDPEEADALVRLFNGHFGADGLTLMAPRPERWYLRSDPALDLCTEPLHRVIGGPVPVDSPSGADARRWAGLANEVQMLFHDSEVNRRREQQRRPQISGLWIWGGGTLPERSGDPPDAVIGDDPLTLGLARWSGVTHRTLDQWSPATPLSGRRHLVFWDRLRTALLERDLGAWSSALIALDERLAEIESEMRRGRLGEILIDPCHGSAYRVARMALLRFWRRDGLAKRLDQS
jgi:hypothetical protein